MGKSDGSREVHVLIYEQEFVAAPALAPPEVQVDQAAMEAYQKEIAEASNMPLPDEGDADL